MPLIDLATDFKIKHIFSYTFPGFFSAITLFMWLSYWSPESTSVISSYVGGKDLTFWGLFVFIGTIFGVILSGIHHSIIEDLLFDRLPEIKCLQEQKAECFRKINGGFAFDKEVKDIKKLKLTRHYAFKIFGGDLDKLNTIIVDDYYSYTEFYSNTFLALIPFSIFVPYYLLANFNVAWFWSCFFGFGSSILAVLCLISGYSNYRTYLQVANSIMFGYAGYAIDKEKRDV